jgi:hypothetical protein
MKIRTLHSAGRSLVGILPFTVGNKKNETRKGELLHHGASYKASSPHGA